MSRYVMVEEEQAPVPTELSSAQPLHKHIQRDRGPTKFHCTEIY